MLVVHHHGLITFQIRDHYPGTSFSEAGALVTDLRARLQPHVAPTRRDPWLSPGAL